MPNRITMNEGFKVEVNSIDKNSWENIMQRFDDANLYQTWSYGAARWGERNLSHLVLKNNEEIVAAAQVIIKKISVFSSGIAYIRWGPLWRLHGKKENLVIFHQILRALRNEYVSRSHLLLRILPNIINEASERILSILKQENFKFSSINKQYRTLLIDLSPPLEDLRKGLKQKWRNGLNRAEKNKLKVIEGNEDRLFLMFEEIYKEMMNRKQFFSSIDIYNYRFIQKDLPSPLKMKIMLCGYAGKPSSAIICDAIGNTGIYLLGATNKNGLQNKASYLLQWNMINWLKKQKFRWYDLGGFDPINYPGSSHFKAGLAGKNGKDVYFIGQFYAYSNVISYFLVKNGDFIRSFLRNIIKIINKLKQSTKSMRR